MANKIVDINTMDINDGRRGAAFSPTDIQALVKFPDGEIVKLGSLSMIKIDTHRDKFPVTAMSFIGPRGFTGGHRTVAGALVFNTLNQNALIYSITGKARKAAASTEKLFSAGLPDQLPLFDVHIHFANEIGDTAFAAVLGVTILDWGTTIAQESFPLMEVVSYQALDYYPMRSNRAIPSNKFYLTNNSIQQTVINGPNGQAANVILPGIDDTIG